MQPVAVPSAGPDQKYCMSCGRLIPASAGFCIYCGKSQSAEKPAAEPSAEIPAPETPASEPVSEPVSESETAPQEIPEAPEE